MDIISPYYLDSTKPPALRCYQSDTRNLGDALVSVRSFGLQWFLQKRLENFLSKNWPPRHTHLFLDICSYAIDKIMTCTDTCMICDKKLLFSMLKPSICEDPLCLFSHEQFGLGVDPASEIASSPEVQFSSFLLSFSFSRLLTSSSQRRWLQPCKATANDFRRFRHILR